MRAAIVLAAGRSRRFGSANKLLARYRGKTLLRRSIEIALAAPVARIVVVLGADRTRTGRVVRGIGTGRISTTFAARHAEGRRFSLLAGLKSLRPGEAEAMIFLGDMPMLDRSIAHRLTKVARDGPAIRATYRNLPGHPVLIRDVGNAIRRLEDGAGPFEKDEIESVEAGRSVVHDIDRPGDLPRHPEPERP